MAAPKRLRVASADDKPAEPMSLMDAVESGDVLAIMKAQRRIIAESLATTQNENTRPQYSNELNKLNALIREEESRRSVEDENDSVVTPLEVQAWDGTGY